ncbi:hypothetical protein LCGC14_2056800 [marine sediment metagenome]|uniref:Uncharacterized protein n=1 Tax=marine sediment metagenome TaxID=412755 RepID=A0A0F9EMJ2_9ZZZZ
MTIATLTIDPGAAALTPNEHVAAINSATAAIDRADSVDPAARPIQAGEITVAELASAAAKGNLDALADVDRGYVQTRPVAASGDFKVIALKRTAVGLVEVEYDDVPV